MKVGGIAVIEGFLRFNSQYHHQKKKRKEKEKRIRTANKASTSH
jgi:hypothetical protein